MEQSSLANQTEDTQVVPQTLESLDLAALLCSRVCHDVISPVGAIVNGLEVLESEDDAGMREFAMELIQKSAKQASARLQYARLAFGAAGSAGAMIDLADAEQVAKGSMHDDRTKLSWSAPRALLPKNHVKLLLNLISVAQHTIPRGGTIDVKVEVIDEKMHLKIVSTGHTARIPTKIPRLIEGDLSEGIDAHGIQPYYTGLIARAGGLSVRFDLQGETVTIDVKPVDTTEA